MSSFFDRWFRARFTPTLIFAKTAIGFAAMVFILHHYRPDTLYTELSISFPMNILQFMSYCLIGSFIAVSMFYTGDYLIYLAHRILKIIYSRLRPGDEEHV